MKQIRKKLHGTNASLEKKRKLGYSVLIILRRKEIILQNLTMPKTLNGGLFGHSENTENSKIALQNNKIIPLLTLFINSQDLELPDGC